MLCPPQEYPKTPEQLASIAEACKQNFLFRHLTHDQLDGVYKAMVCVASSRLARLLTELVCSLQFEKKVPAGETIITQGEPGDFFYVVERGEFDIFVTKDGVTDKVVVVEDGGRCAVSVV